jgi:hypothetical protein
MDGDSKDLAKISVEAVVKPFGELLTKLLGGSAEQIGGIGEDYFADIRHNLAGKRQRRRVETLLAKTKYVIEDAGFEPKGVPDEILIPLLRAASLQDEATLQDMWANLLANAANPDGETIRRVFINILCELSPNDALFLDKFIDAPEPPFGMPYPEMMLAQFHPTGDSDDVQITLAVLRRSQLIDQHFAVMVPGDPSAVGGSNPIPPTYTLSGLGMAFVRACRAPKKQ